MRRFFQTTLGLRSFAFLTLLLAGFSSTVLAGTTIHVPADQPTIQAGINAAVNGDTVLVSPGTYYENINFNGKAITVKSASGPAATIIDGSNGYSPVVTFSSGETLKSVIAGFTIRNGYPNISLSSSSATIKGNVIGNTAAYYIDGIDVYSGGAVIQGNLITGNGNGIYTTFDTGIQILGNIVARNNNLGISLGETTGSEIVQQNTILKNSNTGFIFQPSTSSSNASVIQNLIELNYLGAVLYSPFTLVSNTIVNNSSSSCCVGDGSEVTAYTIDANVTMQNNLIVGTGVLPAFSCGTYTATPVFTNNDVFSVNSSAYGGSCSDQTGTSGNFSADPVFVDSLTDNLHIQAQSPVIGAGINTAPQEPNTDFDGDNRILGGTIDIGADEYSAHPPELQSPGRQHHQRSPGCDSLEQRQDGSLFRSDRRRTQLLPNEQLRFLACRSFELSDLRQLCSPCRRPDREHSRPVYHCYPQPTNRGTGGDRPRSANANFLLLLFLQSGCRNDQHADSNHFKHGPSSPADQQHRL